MRSITALLAIVPLVTAAPHTSRSIKTDVKCLAVIRLAQLRRLASHKSLVRDRTRDWIDLRNAVTGAALRARHTRIQLLC